MDNVPFEVTECIFLLQSQVVWLVEEYIVKKSVLWTVLSAFFMWVMDCLTCLRYTVIAFQGILLQKATNIHCEVPHED